VEQGDFGMVTVKERVNARDAYDARNAYSEDDADIAVERELFNLLDVGITDIQIGKVLTEDEMDNELDSM
jgi:hypothetical protein